MAQYDHLPVFKKSYNLLLAVYQSVSMFGKEHKYTIGENLKKEALEIIVCIYKTNGRIDKSGMTTTAVTNITQTTATSGGNVTSDGGATVSARGVCWSTILEKNYFDKRSRSL
jgi:hypothetical protein